MIRLLGKGTPSQGKCLIAKGNSRPAIPLTGPATANPPTRMVRVPLRVLWSVPRLDVLACGGGVRAWAWAMARTERRALTPRGAGLRQAGAAEKKESLPPPPQLHRRSTRLLARASVWAVWVVLCA